MLSSQESIKIIDLGTGESEIIPKSTGIPLDFAIDIEENVAYWVNDLEEIFSSRINGSGHYKVKLHSAQVFVHLKKFISPFNMPQRELLARYIHIMYVAVYIL